MRNVTFEMYVIYRNVRVTSDLNPNLVSLENHETRVETPIH